MRNRYAMAVLGLALAATASALLFGGVAAKTQEVPVDTTRSPNPMPTGVTGGLNNGLNNGLNGGLNTGLNTNLGTAPGFSGAAGSSDGSGSRRSLTPDELARQLASDRQYDLKRLPVVDKLHHFTRQ